MCLINAYAPNNPNDKQKNIFIKLKKRIKK